MYNYITHFPPSNKLANPNLNLDGVRIGLDSLQNNKVFTAAIPPSVMGP